MSDDHNKSDPEMDGSEVVHTEFDDWRTLPPGTDFNYRGIHVGTVVKISISGIPSFSTLVGSSGKFVPDRILKRFILNPGSKGHAKLEGPFYRQDFLCWDGEVLSSKIDWVRSNFKPDKGHYEEFYNRLREWTGLDRPLRSGSAVLQSSGALLELSKEGMWHARNGTFAMIRNKAKSTSLPLTSLTRSACHEALAHRKIRAYTQGQHDDFSNFTLRYVVENETKRGYAFGKNLESGLEDSSRIFGSIGPFFWNATTVRLELVYDLITIGYEMDLPGDGSSVAPHTLERPFEAPVQLPLMLEKVVLTFIRNKEHLGRPLSYRLRRITDDNENEGSGKE